MVQPVSRACQPQPQIESFYVGGILLPSPPAFGKNVAHAMAQTELEIIRPLESFADLAMNGRDGALYPILIQPPGGH